MCRRKSTEEAKKKSKRCCTADFCCILCHLGTFGLIIASLIVLASEMGDLRDKLQKYEANGNTEVITCPIEGQVPSRSGRHCQCEDNRLLLHLNLLSCEPSCGVNEVASDNDDIKKCICQNGFKIEKTTQGTERCVACFLTEKTFNNECFPVCPDGTVEDPNKRECLCAKKDSLNHKGKCICREYRLLDGTCGDSCGIHQASRMDSGEKVCECSEGYSKNAAGQCECNTGMIDSQGSCRRECNSPMVLMADDFRQIKVCRCEDKAKQPRRVDGIEKCVCPRFENKDVGCVNDCGEREIAIMDPQSGVKNLCFCDLKINTLDSSNNCIAKAEIKSSKLDKKWYIIIGVGGGLIFIAIIVITVVLVRRSQNKGGIQYMEDLNLLKDEEGAGIINSWPNKNANFNINTFDD